jgi:hypothetical protein
LGIAQALAAGPEDADAQEKIASEFKVRVSYSPADMSKPAGPSST